jgi:intracellular septation protein
MQLLFEFLPLILFLVAYMAKGIYFALGVLMVAMPIGLGVKYWRTRQLDRMYMWSTIFLLVAGAATFWFRNPKFLYWKPTAFYWALAVAFIASNWVGHKPLVQRFFEVAGDFPTSNMSHAQWKRLNAVWAMFFAVMGLLNIYVAYNYPESFWVNFKVFGLMGLTVVFMLAQGFWLFSRLGIGSEKDSGRS